MRLKYFIIIFICFSFFITAPVADPVRHNQLGYNPHRVKQFVTVNNSSTTFTILDHSTQVVFSGPLTSKGTWAASGETVKMGDFSELSDTGTYTIKLSDNTTTSNFKISENLYQKAIVASTKAFYYQRASMSLEAKYAGTWAREGGHFDKSCVYHSSSGHSSGTLSSPKGWYDAGDYNKYVVNAGVTVGTLLALYELYPAVLPDKSINIPESDNSISDLLDEVKYELDWLLTMQDSDGGVFFKITSLSFCDFIMPKNDNMARYVVGKATASTLDFAAMTAKAARIWVKIDTIFSNKCIVASEKAWKWARANQNITFKNPSDVSTGAYTNSSFGDEFLWAASEIFATTAKSEYLEFVNSYRDSVAVGYSASWSGVGNLGYYTLATNSNVPPDIATTVQNSIIIKADTLLSRIQAIPYGIPSENFGWGSNGSMMNLGIILAYAYKFTNNLKYLDALVQSADYIFGKNAVDYCFMTGQGTNSVKHPHHRPSGADGIDAPVPGFLSGGPNKGKDDKLTYPYSEPARCFLDDQSSFASNEIAINWNAPLVFVLGFLHENRLAPSNSATGSRTDMQHTRNTQIALTTTFVQSTKKLQINLNCSIKGPLSISIINLQGRCISRFAIPSTGLSNTSILSDGRTLTPGLFVTRIESSGKTLAMNSIMVN